MPFNVFIMSKSAHYKISRYYGVPALDGDLMGRGEMLFELITIRIGLIPEFKQQRTLCSIRFYLVSSVISLFSYILTI